ncbi:MAG: Maf family protein [Sumerlaeia bacterium]
MAGVPRLVLASGSPRRRELLTQMGLQFEVLTSDVDERAIPADHPRTFAIRAAYAKAKDVAAKCHGDNALVIAADTVVTHRDVLYGKPTDAADARWMLGNLSGQTHQVITAIALAKADGGDVLLDSATTRVTFRTLAPEEIQHTIAHDPIFDKAGSYAIQERAGEFVTRLEGDYYNVVGLPLEKLVEMLDGLYPVDGLHVPPPPSFAARWYH